MHNFRKLSDSFDMECINDSHDGVGGQYSVQTVLYMYSVQCTLCSPLHTCGPQYSVPPHPQSPGQSTAGDERTLSTSIPTVFKVKKRLSVTLTQF